MRRRELTLLLGSSAIGWPVPAMGQQLAMPLIGFLNSRSPADTGHLLAGFRKGLAENGYVEGQNLTIEYRWAMGQYERLLGLAAELAEHHIAVLVATGGEPVGVAAKAATSTIPIVFVISGGPAKLGLAASFSRPSGNSTGVASFTSDIGAKRLGLLRELVPEAARIGFLSSPAFPTAETQLNDVEEGARTLGIEIEVFRASTAPEIDSAFNMMAQRRPAALIVAADPFFDTRRVQLVVLTARHAVRRDLSSSRVRRGGRVDQLRHRSGRCLSPSWQLHRKDPRGGQAGGAARGAADPVRAGNQSADGQGARPDCAAIADRRRRRGDRMNDHRPRRKASPQNQGRGESQSLQEYSDMPVPRERRIARHRRRGKRDGRWWFGVCARYRNRVARRLANTSRVQVPQL